MKRMRFVFGVLLSLVGCVSISCEEIVVQVDSEVQLVPVTLDGVKSESSSFDRNYLASLEAILRYDFSHNGSTRVLEAGEGTYILSPGVNGDQFAITIREKGQSQVQEMGGIALSGDLAVDRKAMHRVADSVHKALFGVDGIAGTHLLYTRKVMDPNTQKHVAEVWEADYDGANAHQVTHEGAYVVTPTYVPPSPGKKVQQFLYVTYKSGQPRIILASLRDSSSGKLTSLRGNQLLPSVNRQSDAVAFISDVTGNPDLFLQPFDRVQGALGKPRQIFTAKGATQGSPTFSPNGQQVAFVSNKAGSAKIYLLNIPEAGTRRKDVKTSLLHKKTRNGTAPVWSPDGTKIAFSSRVDGVRQIWVFDFTQGEEWQLTKGPKHKENPSWAPNSKHLVYNTVETNSADLYVIDVVRKQPVKLKMGAGEFHYPSWEPRTAMALGE